MTYSHNEILYNNDKYITLSNMNEVTDLMLSKSQTHKCMWCMISLYHIQNQAKLICGTMGFMNKSWNS